ncbi:MAG: NAD(P)/FAD-dependent oxidoreductase [bacterium]
MKTQQVIVVGAGIVGICVALSLRKRGIDVLLLDRLPPASETSSGNAGVICNSGIHPLANPNLIKQAPKLLANLDPRLLLSYREAPWLMPWLIQFARNCNNSAFEQNTAEIATLTGDALDRHRDLMQRADALQLLQNTGWLKLFRSASVFSALRSLVSDYQRYGVTCNVLDSSDVRELEPDLGRDYAGAWWLKDTPSVADPKLLCQRYFDLLISNGGRYHQCQVNSIERHTDDWQVKTDESVFTSSTIVLTLGAWTNQLLKPLGVRLPFVLERGYHMMFAHPENKRLGRSVLDVELGFVMTPMRDGIRTTTASNLVAREVAPQDRQLRNLMPHIQETFPVGEKLLEKAWMGRRASTADSKPLIGPIRNHQGLFVATGHCHLGLTLGPITGELIADEVLGCPNPLCKPFYPDRISSTI